MSTPTALPKRQSITLAQLSSYDDIITDVLIDHAYYWTTIPKNRPSYHPSRGVTEEEITKIIQSHIIVDPDLEIAESKLLATSGLRRFYNTLKTSKEQSDFRAHLLRYMRVHLPDCPYEVNSTNRYTIYNHEASITARKFIKRGQRIKYLSGIQVTISATEDKELAKRKKDFSIVISSRNKCAALFMGPARFANHDCNANARLMITGQADIEIVATRNIYVGDEITISYAENYFGDNNCECLCKTCEDKVVNGWAADEGSGEVKRSIEDIFTEGYSLRRRRRRDDSSASGSRTSSVTPDIRPRIRKSKQPKTQNGGPERESLCGSPAPHDILRQKRKREFDSLQSPPITPTKRVKMVQYELGPVPIRGGLEMRTGDDTTSSEHSGSSFMISDLIATTDATTPEEEPQDTALRSPVSTPDRPLVLTLGEEDSDSSSLTNFSRTPSMAPVLLMEVSRMGVPSADVSNMVVASKGISSTEISNSVPSNMGVSEMGVPTLAVSNTELPAEPEENSTGSVITWDKSTANVANYQADEILSLDLVASPATVTSFLEEALPIPVTSPGDVIDVPGQEQDRGPLQQSLDGKLGTAGPGEEATQVAHKRTPGDYTLTPVLLSEACMAWIHCTNCGDAFVQQDAYYTRSSCFRCERHSKLYGYPWPKTEKEGPSDKEERILDHRTIHRFLGPEEEAKIRGRKLNPPSARPKPSPAVRAKSSPVIRTKPTPTGDLSPEKRATPKPKKQPVPSSTVEIQRPKRQRKPSLKAALSQFDALFLAGA